MADPGDQVGTDNGPKPRPWERPFARDRAREMGYTLLSWPYILAFVLTVFFIVRTDVLTLQAMGSAWLVAFGRRELANYMAQRQNHVPASRLQGGIG